MPSALKKFEPIIVTGAAGFIGSRFAEACLSSGIETIGVDLPEHFSARAEVKDIPFTRIVPRDSLFDELKSGKLKAGAIVHLGACTDTMELDEAYLKRVNIEYSQAIWEYCSKAQIRLVYASSAATYGDGELGYADDESQISKLKALNPYGESKRLFDLWALEQERKGNTPPSWSGFKFFNVYGFGERHKGKMASVVLHSFDQIQASGSTRLFKSHKTGIADGHQKRDFIHVDDVISVLSFALSKPIQRGIYNLGTGQARTFLDLVKAVFQSLEKPEKVEFIDTPIALRDRYQYFTEAQMGRLREAGYSKPFLTIEEGVRRYVKRLLAQRG